MTVTASRRLLAVVTALLASAVMEGTALGHAALVASSPPEGARVSADQVRTVTLTFDDDLNTAKSRFALVTGDGSTAATGTVGGDARTMTAGGLSLAPGTYEARWTAVASDGDLTRGIVTFTVVADGALGTSSADPAIAALASPGAASGGPTRGAPSGGDVVLPIAAAFAIVGGVAALVLRRSRVG